MATVRLQCMAKASMRVNRATHPRASCVRAVASASVAPIHIVGISGSPRKSSVHTGMLRAAARTLPAGATLEIVDLGGLPIYNDDLWQASGCV
ncbi:hypothetical protein GPECTOR_11g4 [Gonium pectorale]|uniref:NAD(P)H dehydrogenase (quinone) n=1 Tax=Gonium pectorale TaxID=33097 RepID=A0A150GQ92_GONPE|nr:hypothetical protein GPECTOR_11g4 [Gonium pectorale]|eukprot:KXZ51912.1 hypothetical protein GPECTOR_11g4 [Gonium pectorale]